VVIRWKQARRAPLEASLAISFSNEDALKASEWCTKKKRMQDNSHILLSIVLVRRRPKAAVQAFKDRQKQKSAFLDATHTMGGPLLRSWTSLSCAGFWFSLLVWDLRPLGAQLSGISQLVKPFDFRRLYRTFALGAHWSRSAANHARTGLRSA